MVQIWFFHIVFSPLQYSFVQKKFFFGFFRFHGFYPPTHTLIVTCVSLNSFLVSGASVAEQKRCYVNSNLVLRKNFKKWHILFLPSCGYMLFQEAFFVAFLSLSFFLYFFISCFFYSPFSYHVPDSEPNNAESKQNSYFSSHLINVYLRL